MTDEAVQPANRPLAGIIVLDFGQVYQGPYATLLMAKAGADVIKIEPPQGEPLRRRAPPGKSTTFPIAMLNGNKRAITLNLKDERGRALLFRMAGKADRAARKLRAGRDGPARRRLERAARDQPAPRLRLGLGLWPQRARSRQSGDGFDDPGGVGSDQHDRVSRRAAGQGGAGGRRFPLRHPPLRRHRDRALRARADRARAASSRWRWRRPPTPR